MAFSASQLPLSQALCPCQSKVSISHRAGCGQKRSPGQPVTQGTHKIFQCTSYLHKRSLVWHCMSFLMLGMSTGYNLISRIQKKNQKISVFLDAFFFFFFHIPRSASNSLFLRSQERKKRKKKKICNVLASKWMTFRISTIEVWLYLIDFMLENLV